jgi:hypothetical protein
MNQDAERLEAFNRAREEVRRERERRANMYLPAWFGPVVYSALGIVLITLLTLIYIVSLDIGVNFFLCCFFVFTVMFFTLRLGRLICRSIGLYVDENSWV